MRDNSESLRPSTPLHRLPADAAPEPGLATLCDSAESVLRGDVVRGPLGWIDDPTVRRRAAVELMQTPPSAELSRVWMSNLPALARPPSFGSLLDCPRCPCGASIRAHEEGDVALMPLSWHLFASSLNLSVRQRVYRAQAVAEFEWALFHVVQAAHSDGPWSRAKRAWAVIDVIDRGGRLIPALAEYFQLSSADVRASRRLTLTSAYAGPAFRTTRRMLRAVSCLRHAHLPHHVEWNDLLRWLPVLDLLTRNTHYAVRDLIRTLPLHAVYVWVKRDTTKPQRRGLLRWLIRQGRKGARHPPKDWRKLLLLYFAGADLSGRKPLTPAIALGDGWTAVPLRDAFDLFCEGEEMSHCLFDYRRSVESGTMVAYSLRSTRAPDRITVSIDVGRRHEAVTEGVRVHASGHSNRPISLDSMQAILMLLRSIEPELAPHGLRLRL